MNQAPISALCFFISIFIVGFRFCLDTSNQNLKQKTKQEQPKQAQARTETMAARQPDERAENTSNWPLMPANAPSITAVNHVAHGAVPHRVECCCIRGIQESSDVASDAVWKSPVLCPPQTSRFEITTFLQQQCMVGYVALWEHSPPFSRLGTASTAAGRCISAGAPPRLLIRLRLLFKLLFVARILRLYVCTPPSFPPKTPKCIGLGFVIHRSYPAILKQKPSAKKIEPKNQPPNNFRVLGETSMEYVQAEDTSKYKLTPNV